MQPFLAHSTITVLLQHELGSLSFQEHWPIPAAGKVLRGFSVSGVFSEFGNSLLNGVSFRCHLCKNKNVHYADQSDER